MDLALEMGMPAEMLARIMTDRELRHWARRARRDFLPSRRLEMYMAQLAATVMRAAGAKNVQISDYLIELAPDPDEEIGEATVEEAQNAFGFAPMVTKRVVH